MSRSVQTKSINIPDQTISFEAFTIRDFDGVGIVCSNRKKEYMYHSSSFGDMEHDLFFRIDPFEFDFPADDLDFGIQFRLDYNVDEETDKPQRSLEEYRHLPSLRNFVERACNSNSRALYGIMEVLMRQRSRMNNSQMLRGMIVCVICSRGIDVVIRDNSIHSITIKDMNIR